MTAYLQELFQLRLFKPKQGRNARQVTLIAIGVVLAVGAWSLKGWLEAEGASSGVALGAPLALLAVTGWAAFRLIQLPKFAEFLIAVEAEMGKVSWPTQSELFKASAVVIFVIFGLAGLLFMYDWILKYVLSGQLLTDLFGLFG
ncbi:preprotein translocase subunit SecE [Botrimarina colliarenosi]|uniref:Protein translocase subunit SecE n=1 Tax=Botrimarina colliarenosi TaxID=2528001 RepID=A0A5C6A9H4_9BACT|nr:preprotein translocase subunit SecE [Botrimarina colliarenosi]TWT96634.1 preprotein translocase subunit SecE [Botrimarina colliarenosi]